MTMTDDPTDQAGAAAPGPGRRSLLTVLPMQGHTRGKRSAVTCHLKCADACSHPAPNLSANGYFRDVVNSAFSRRALLAGAGAGAAAVVIGGVSINGGVGTVLGTVLGVLLLGCVAAALPFVGIPGTTQNAIYGAVILIALVIDRSVRQHGIASLARRTA